MGQNSPHKLKLIFFSFGSEAELQHNRKAKLHFQCWITTDSSCSQLTIVDNFWSIKIEDRHYRSST